MAENVTILKRLDSAAGISPNGVLAVWTERLAFVFLVLMVVSAPHSIAATQTAWLIGMLFWISRMFFTPRPAIKLTFLAVPAAALFAWSVVSSLVSYAPDISLRKLASASLFLIFFFALNNLRTRRSVTLVAVLLIGSSMVSVLWTPMERIIGKGVKVHSLSRSGPLYAAGFRDNDSLFAANRRRLDSPDDLVAEIERSGKAMIRYYRAGHYWQFEIGKDQLLPGASAATRLGFKGWSVSRSWRSSGFYGHYATFAEVLLQIAALAFGFLIASFGINAKRQGDNNVQEADRAPPDDVAGRNSSAGKDRGARFLSGIPFVTPVLAVCILLMSLALVMTLMRASLAGFFFAGALIVVSGGSRKLLAAFVIVAIPVIIGGAIFLQQTRGEGVFDTRDQSTSWRETVYREGLSLWTRSARNFTFGVGMDSIKRFKEEWKLFDNGRLPTGHFHSTPLQLLVERGFPALIFWVSFLGLYVLMLFRSIRKRGYADWTEKGIVLGAFGGVCGFLLSSLVHYNYGDGEVVMVLYLVMAMSLSVCLRTKLGERWTPKR